MNKSGEKLTGVYKDGEKWNISKFDKSGNFTMSDCNESVNNESKYIIKITNLNNIITDAYLKIDGKITPYLDDVNKKATWLDGIFDAEFSATTVNFIVYEKGFNIF